MTQIQKKMMGWGCKPESPESADSPLTLPGSVSIFPPGRVNDLVHGRRAITPDTAVRLAVFFGTSEAFWINLQAQHDARIARRDLRPAIEKQIDPHPHAA